ncbi:hypothetical protein [Nostoc sp.]|uniref:hypothetical protein n=1 Tax=Nostoc sp. TaxID=1180 RepID=UPI002FFB9702
MSSKKGDKAQLYRGEVKLYFTRFGYAIAEAICRKFDVSRKSLERDFEFSPLERREGG